MELSVLQLVAGLLGLCAIVTWGVVRSTTCVMCRRRFAMEKVLGRRVEGLGRVMRRSRCKFCGWEDWREQPPDHDHL